jgi:signal transduction histidine kinase/ActR/RegA family two-component response regulator
VTILERSDIAARHDQTLALDSRSGAVAALIAFSLSLGTAILGLAFTYRGLAVVWPAAGVVTGLWLVTPARHRYPVVAAIVAGLFAGNLVAGRTLLLNAMFIGANLGEAWLVTALLRRWIGRPIQLATLRQVGWFILAVVLTVTIGGAIGAIGLVRAPAIGLDYFDNWFMWVRSRGIGMLTVAPAVIALATMPRRSLAEMWRDGKVTLVAMAALVLLTSTLVSFRISSNELLSLLFLLAIVYPLILLVAARSEPVWTYISLLTVTLLVVWRLGHGGGLFDGDVEVAQAFMLVSSLWALTLAVVLEQQRRASDKVQLSERSMRAALAAGRGFTFDYDPLADFVRRADPDQILAPFMEESGASFFERVLPEDRARLQHAVTSLSPASPTYDATYGSRRPDGRIVWLQERGIAEFDETGTLIRLQGLTMDVTARREAEEALREADRKKDRFIATLAHELRNPLAPIRTAADLLGSAQAGSAEIDWARKVIQRQVGHMGALLDDLLDVARITRGKLDIRKRRVRLDGVIETAVEAARPVIDSRNQHLEIDAPPDAPLLEADPLRLAQVISNLLTNAAKYSDPGGRIKLTARATGPRLQLSVKDTGIGIPAGKLEHIFEMFSQLQEAGERSEGGLGIGLSLVKGLVELHGGTVTAHSSGPGRGSEFVVTVPCIVAEESGDGAGPARLEAAGNGRRLLVVDDNRDAADSLALLLGLDGHDVRVAYTGRQALEIARAFLPHAAILDLGLPDLSGYDVARQMRREPALAGVRLVALSGWGQDEHQQRAREAGFDHHLIKPADPDELLALLAAQPSS